MKRFFLAALAIATVASCAKNEVNEVTANDQITFQTVVGPNTKALIVDRETYLSSDPSFGTVAYYNANDPLITFPNGADLYIPESKVLYNDSHWTTGTPYYWPKNGSLTFFSYSPYDELEATMTCDLTNGLTLSNWDVDANQDVDVMVADVQTGQTANGSNGGYEGVPTIFRHKLSQIVDVTFSTDKDYANTHDGTTGNEFVAGDKQFFINYVKINKLEQIGTYTSGLNVSGSQLGEWVLPATPTYDCSYDWFTETAPCEKEFFKSPATSAKTRTYLLVMPQTYENFTAPQKAADVSNVEVKYTIRTYTDESHYSTDVVTAHVSMYDIFSTSHTLDMNKKVTINFTIGVNQIYWAPSVVDWSTQTGAATIN